MARPRATRLAIDETDLPNLRDISGAAEATRSLHRVLLSPFHSPHTTPAAPVAPFTSPEPAGLTPLNTATANMPLATATNALPPQAAYTHLPYGPEREAIILTNLHMSHLHHANEQRAAQTTLLNSTIARLTASHRTSTNQLLTHHHTTIDHLLVNLATTHHFHNIDLWRYGVHHAINPTTTTTPNPATDLLPSKFADLRSAPLAALAAVKAAESASDPGRKRTGMTPSIASVFGIEGQGYLQRRGGEGVGRLYGEVEDAGEDEGEDDDDESSGSGSGSGFGSGTASVTLLAEEDEEEEQEQEQEQEEIVGADARRAAVVPAKPRRRLLGRLRRFFRI